MHVYMATVHMCVGTFVIKESNPDLQRLPLHYHNELETWRVKYEDLHSKILSSPIAQLIKSLYMNFAYTSPGHELRYTKIQELLCKLEVVGQILNFVFREDILVLEGTED